MGNYTRWATGRRSCFELERIAHNQAVSDCVIKGAYTDFIRVYASGDVVSENTIIDSFDAACFEQAHRDGIQLIPSRLDGTQQTQFAAAELNNVSIIGNKILSENKLQCIFASDGLFHDLTIKNNTLCTQGAHYITIAGLVSGRIENNRLPDGRLCPIRLDPLRIGGNSAGFNVYIISFKCLNYAPLDQIVLDADLSHVLDFRHGHSSKNPRDVYLSQFDLFGFIAAVQKKQFSPLQLQLIAMRYGHIEQGFSLNTMSNYGLQHLMQSEGFRSEVYADTAGNLTIGVGHLLTKDELSSGKIHLNNGELVDFRKGSISDGQVRSILADDVDTAEGGVNALVTVPLTQNQFDALVSFVFNIGVTAFKNSTLLKKLNRAQYAEIPNELRRWNKQTVLEKLKNGEFIHRKVTVKGLVNRREREVALWNGEHTQNRNFDVIQNTLPLPMDIGESGYQYTGSEEVNKTDPVNTQLVTKASSKPLAKSRAFWNSIIQAIASGLLAFGITWASDPQLQAFAVEILVVLSAAIFPVSNIIIRKFFTALPISRAK